ncbi:MAG: twin-arginine translocase subunit TatC [Candidatus Bostrichicola ureolyticus]|nr:MAG: twin-arginine translocase subunit TatC [Candidatus Bostrichicola ureolyticus]
MTDSKLPFIGHIKILRKHIIRSLCSIILSGIILMFNKEIIFDKIIFGPIKNNFITYRLLKTIGNFFCDHVDFSPNFKIQNRKILGQFNIYISVCIIGGFIISFPYICYELWMFIKPGLTIKEQKFYRIITIISYILFILGIFFGYFLLSPMILQFGDNFKISNIPQNVFDLSDYIFTIIISTFYMGIVFLFPICAFVLTKLGLITPNLLHNYRKHAILLILIIASAITPGDIINTIVALIPIILLYQISVFIVSLVYNKKL